MPFDGQGNAARAGIPVVDGTPIDAADIEVPVVDIYAMLNMVSLRDGRAPATGDQNFGGNDIINVGNIFTTSPFFAVSSKNLIDNPIFSINQRGYVSGAATVAANQVTLDRWRVVSSGQAVTFSNLENGRQITAPAGGLEQIIEANRIAGGTYTLSWTGTATATINGASTANGGSVVIPANTQTTIRLIGGTASRVQLEHGPGKTSFEVRPLAVELLLCERHYEKSYEIGLPPANASPAGMFVSPTQNGAIGVVAGSVAFKTRKQSVPTVTIYNHVTGVAGQVRDNGGAASAVSVTSGETGFYWQTTGAALAANSIAFGQWTAATGF
jgi:hypothetical protein